jgi:hypothetical protein
VKADDSRRIRRRESIGGPRVRNFPENRSSAPMQTNRSVIDNPLFYKAWRDLSGEFYFALSEKYRGRYRRYSRAEFMDNLYTGMKEIVPFNDRPGGFIFVRDPRDRTLFMRVSRVVDNRSCPHCHSKKGEPCMAYYSVYLQKKKKIPKQYHTIHHIARSPRRPEKWKARNGC